MWKHFLLMAMLASSAALAQATTEPLPPPPMVPATPPPMPAPEPTTAQPGTPPPPSGGAYLPGQKATGYQYSPYGQPKSQEKPKPEIGLMVSESLFGMLSAAGITVLPYFLLFGTGALNFGGDDPRLIPSILLGVIFGATPLAVAQTQIGIANGSRYYQSEMWIPALTGLAGMGGVLAIYFALGGLPQGYASGATPDDATGRTVFLFVGAIGIVPVLQMVAINLFKQPKPGMTFALGDPAKGVGVAFNPPSLSPIINASNNVAGAQLSLLSGRW